jgi:hypothetical protein
MDVRTRFLRLRAFNKSHVRIDLTLAASLVSSITLSACDVTGADSGATQLGIIAQPTTAEAGTVIAPSVRIVIQDADALPVRDATNPVTIEIGTDPGGCILSGVTTVNAVGGFATFADLSIEQPGDGYTLVATSGSLSSVTSTAFEIVERCAELPTPVPAFTGTEDYIDAFGNPYTEYRIPVTNWSDFPAYLFHLTPDYGPCDLNENPSRTWVGIFRDDGSWIYGFCAFDEPQLLQGIWFGIRQGTTPPPAVYIELHDRGCELTTRSDLLELP